MIIIFRGFKGILENAGACSKKDECSKTKPISSLHITSMLVWQSPMYKKKENND